MGRGGANRQSMLGVLILALFAPIAAAWPLLAGPIDKAAARSALRCRRSAEHSVRHPRDRSG
ncbi:MAG: hypothetical protein R3C32_15100 [Chloroflexota bacterium]